MQWKITEIHFPFDCWPLASLTRSYHQSEEECYSEVHLKRVIQLRVDNCECGGFQCSMLEKLFSH